MNECAQRPTLIRAIVSSFSMSISISLPVRVFTLIYGEARQHPMTTLAGARVVTAGRQAHIHGLTVCTMPRPEAARSVAGQ